MIAEFHNPETIQKAVELRSVLGDGTWFLGGGTELNSLKPPSDRIEHLINLDHLGMRSIEVGSTEIIIGAGCTLQELVESGEIPEVIRLACLHVENRSIRNQATVGGHIAAGQPYASLLPILVALEATVDVMTVTGTSSTDPVVEHIGGTRRALISAVRIPAFPVNLYAAVDQHCRSKIDLAMLTVAVVYRLEGDLVLTPRIVVGGLTGMPQRLSEVERQLDGVSLPSRDALERLVAEHVQPNSSPRASADFKRYMAGALVARALMGVTS